MIEIEIKEVDPVVAATEYTLRLRLALERAKEASSVLHYTKGELRADDVQELLETISVAAVLAERGFRLDHLIETSTMNGAWLAAEAKILGCETEGMNFRCANLPGCAAERLCAMNNLIDRMVADGCCLTGVKQRHLPVPYSAMADGCTKMQPRVFREDDPCLATSSRWTGDTASVKARG